VPLSARRLRRRPVAARLVGLPTRVLASLVDAVIPSVGLWVLIATGNLELGFLEPHPGQLPIDRYLELLYERPALYLYPALVWMLMWTGLSLVFLGTIERTPGKVLLRLRIRQSSGRVATGTRMLARIAAGWLVPLSLGLSYLWIFVSPRRQAWHDTLSGTYVVRDAPLEARRRGSEEIGETELDELALPEVEVLPGGAPLSRRRAR
jgi:uncharacterized RDD family membrane protein YckC